MTTAPTGHTRRTDTRELILGVALDLFAERGYEGASLREIAERLGVTKAAVYYHFRSKEEILASLFEEQMAGIDAIIAWADAQVPGPARTREVIERYSALLRHEGGAKFSRMIQAQQSLKAAGPGEEVHRRFRALSDLMAAPRGSSEDVLRSRLALMALRVGAFAFDDLPGDADTRCDAAMRIALELVDPRASPPGPAG